MPVMCCICEKVFSVQSSHNRHIREVHQKNPEPVSYSSQEGKGKTFNSRCLEPDCDNNVFKNNKGLMDHLRIIHLMKFETECHVMENMNDFENWKSNMETVNNCSYVLKSRNASTSGEIIYYKCNRSKISYILKDSDQRRKLLKSQGSCKMSSSCTSEIKVIKENDKICIEWQKIHYGHKLDIQHIRLPKTEKLNIATKIINGVTPQRILESTRDNIGLHLKRVDLLTTKDLTNIKNSYGLELKNGKRDSNDAFSVALWVQECENLRENPILFYKEQGKEHSILRKDDFCLIIMNKFQRQMIKQFPSTITIDSTHGLNGYDFEMTTIMVLDEYHHGFPVAEMFTNRKDTVVQSIFFSAVKEIVGVVHCKFFMSDMDEVFVNAWFRVMGTPYPQHLLCSWHVDRAWQKNLKKISNKEKRTEIYKLLKILQQETPESKFVTTLGNAISYICNDDETKDFGEYFGNTYSHNFKKWAYCFRKDASINTNMHLESMHKVIKYFYLERKKVKRLDKGLNMVIKYVRDKSVERIIRLSKGEHTRQTRLLSQNHKEALKNMNEYIILKNNTNWNISKNENSSYTVHQLLESKCCAQICLFCDMCSHMFSCECKFYKERKTICKHIHMIVAKLVNSKMENNPKVHSTDEDNSISQSLSALSQKHQEPNSRHNVDQIKAMVIKLESLDFHQLDDATISKIHHHLSIINNLAKSSKFSEICNEFIPKNKSSKRYIDPQIRFTSTKKKRVAGKTSFTRASTQEAATIQENLEHIPGESFIYKSVLSLNDHQYC